MHSLLQSPMRWLHEIRRRFLLEGPQCVLWYPCAMRLLHDAIRNVPG